MCWAEKCCFFFKLDLGCIIAAVVNFVLSTVLTVVTTVLLFDGDVALQGVQDPPVLRVIIQSYLSEHSIRIVLWIVFIVGVLWMASSLMLLVGVSKRKPGLVLAYFAYGICVTIVSQLSALLVLLSGHWPISIIIFIGSIIHIHFLVVVHTVYENLQKGKVFGFSPHDRLLEEESVCDN